MQGTLHNILSPAIINSVLKLVILIIYLHLLIFLKSTSSLLISIIFPASPCRIIGSEELRKLRQLLRDFQKTQ